jgi:hypothetical protein
MHRGGNSAGQLSGPPATFFNPRRDTFGCIQFLGLGPESAGFRALAGFGLQHGEGSDCVRQVQNAGRRMASVNVQCFDETLLRFGPLTTLYMDIAQVADRMGEHQPMF